MGPLFLTPSNVAVATHSNFPINSSASTTMNEPHSLLCGRYVWIKWPDNWWPAPAPRTLRCGAMCLCMAPGPEKGW